MDEENKLKCDECGEELSESSYIYKKPEGESPRKVKLVCTNDKKCKKAEKQIPLNQISANN